MGDDATDEDAFGAVRSAGGVAVFVGAPGLTTCATWRLSSPSEVSAALVELVTL